MSSLFDDYEADPKIAASMMALQEARRDAALFGGGYLRVNADGILRRLNPIGVRIDEVEAMKP